MLNFYILSPSFFRPVHLSTNSIVLSDPFSAPVNTCVHFPHLILPPCSPAARSHITHSLFRFTHLHLPLATLYCVPAKFCSMTLQSVSDLFPLTPGCCFFTFNSLPAPFLWFACVTDILVCTLPVNQANPL